MISLLFFIYITISVVLFFATLDEGSEVSLAWAIFWPILFIKKAYVGFLNEWNNI